MSRDARGVASRRAGALRRAAPLLLLGGARLAAVAATGYVVPLGEYGAHWNFFFTLAAVAALAAAAPAPVRGGAASAGLAAAAVLAAHEAALRGGMAAWLDAPRGADLLSRNREGICSVVRRACAMWQCRHFMPRDADPLCRAQPGYWGLYLGGVAVGRLLLLPAAAAGKRDAPLGAALLRVRCLSAHACRCDAHAQPRAARRLQCWRRRCGARAAWRALRLGCPPGVLRILRMRSGSWRTTPPRLPP